MSGGRVSNYWRPSFVLWMIANVRVFGLASTVGWHIGNVALHALTTGLAYALPRRLGLSAPVAGAIALLFAVHPAHVESVAWLSGAPDLILAPALLGSLWFVLRTIDRPMIANWGAAIGLYVVAQGAKEVAIFYPVIAGLAVLGAARVDAVRPAHDRWATAPWRPALVRGTPFAIIALAYLMVRHALLGPALRTPMGDVEISADLCSAPEIGAFYLRQMVFPLRLGPSYPARPVVPSVIDWANFGVPLVVCMVAGLWMLWEAWRSRIAALGLALLVLPLAPAMHVAAFMPEHIVHDRYLYLPLLGFLMIVVPAVSRLLERAGAPASQGRRRWHVLALGAACAVPLSIQTLRYNTAWASELALWTWAEGADGSSASNLTQLAVCQREAAKVGGKITDPARMEEARRTADRALAIATKATWYTRPELPNVLLIRADIAIDQGRYGDARADLLAALEAMGPGSGRFEVFQVYERLALCNFQQQRLAEAESVLREARSRLPRRQCALTQMLAVVLTRENRENDAIRELESVRGAVEAELSPESRLALYRLGILYLSAGRLPEARVALSEFLDLSEGMAGEELSAARAQVQKILGPGGRRSPARDSGGRPYDPACPTRCHRPWSSSPAGWTARSRWPSRGPTGTSASRCRSTTRSGTGSNWRARRQSRSNSARPSTSPSPSTFAPWADRP